MVAPPDAVEVWIWSEGSGVRLWTPEESFYVDAGAPHRPGFKDSLVALRGGLTKIALRSAVTEGVAQPLEKLLAGSSPVRLRLAADLSNDWQMFPFEWLLFNERPLQGRLIVERYVQKSACSLSFPPDASVSVLVLLPSEESKQYFPNLPDKVLLGMDVSREPGELKGYLAAMNLSALSAVIVIAHGTEDQSTSPFRNCDGKPWALPTERGLPPLVVLLACGADSGNLVDYARSLLECGAQTVIASIGKLGFSGAAQFFEAFCTGWSSEMDVAEILLNAQLALGSNSGAQRLCIVGNGDLHTGSARSLHEISDEALAANFNNSLDSQDSGLSLLHLVNRVTLRQFQSSGTLDGAVTDLRQALQIAEGDENSEKRLVYALDQVQETAWPLSRVWLVPFVAFLAEAYDQRLLGRYEGMREESSRLGKLVPPETHHYWSRIYYRDGRYHTALGETCQGLHSIPESEANHSAYLLLGGLLNILIDLNLPEEAGHIEILLQGAVDFLKGESGIRQGLNLLDRTARLSLRRGDSPGFAIERYERKREREKTLAGGSGLRELAWLLYLSAWEGQPGAAQYASEVESILQRRGEVMENLGTGNDDYAYLLRAIALWTWRSKNPKSADIIRAYDDFWWKRLSLRDVDPGPVGVGAIFLHLYCKEASVNTDWLPSREKVRENLGAYRYWLELSALSALLLDESRAKDYLQRFQFHRRQALHSLDQLPSWAGLPQWRDHLKTREAHEQDSLPKFGRNPALLVASGLLPL